MLYQNFPNPFNPVTSIPFELKTASHIKLRVYDIRGLMVTELVNGGWSAGKFISGFDGTNLSSGVYFYRIEITADNTSEKFFQTKRMVLIK
ncbi:MAG: T9SS type A sorting domain-containing protein [Ignavibacteria bacterium]|nr:T9SS type A sorting domain-containing protein [Ignavibacteria bacterium]